MALNGVKRPRDRFDAEERLLLQPLAPRPYTSVLVPNAPRGVAPSVAPRPQVSVGKRPLAVYARLTGGGRMKIAVPSRRDRLRQMLADLHMPGALEALDAILHGVDGATLTAVEAIQQCSTRRFRGNSDRMRQHTELWQALHTTPDPDAGAPRRRRTRQEAATN